MTGSILIVDDEVINLESLRQQFALQIAIV